MNKAFTEEQLQELALLMFDSGHLTLPEHETILTKWFKQNPIEPVVVGLSDEQIDNLSNTIWSKLDTDKIDFVIKKWLKNQTFAQPEQFDVNWEGVSGNADYVMLKMEMYNADGKLVQCINIKTQYRPRFEKFS